MDSSDSDIDEDAPLIYALHNIAEAGDQDALREVLAATSARVDDAGGDAAMGMSAALRQQVMPQMLAMKDFRGCTPLHLAVLSASPGCTQLLLAAGAKASTRCDGHPVLCLAACVGLLPERKDAAVQILKLLVDAGARARDTDDGGRTALHWVAAAGLDEAVVLLTAAAGAGDAQRLAQWELDSQALVETGASAPPKPEFSHLADSVDADGLTALHVAAGAGHAGVVAALMQHTPEALAKMRSKEGLTALHLAASRGRSGAAAALLRALPPAVRPAHLKLADRKGRVAADIAERSGHKELAAALRAYVADGDASFPADGPPQGQGRRTMCIAPDECLQHLTAPDPIIRGGSSPPPENVDRLKVLTTPGTGILHCSEFGHLQWVTRDVEPAPLADVLRCHDYAYVKRIEDACKELPPGPSAIGRLDMDTSISHDTYKAALVAAGATLKAVDEVMAGNVANVFCAVRPPGHHAGPSGAVTNANDPNGSHGFCLLSNIAIAGAYAMNVYRHAGIRRVALLDFDVHHGNGTEAVVANCVPGQTKVSLSTPYSEGMQTFPTCKPWLGTDDGANILFASVQGYGRGPHGGWFYPGSGATHDTRGPGRDGTPAQTPARSDAEAMPPPPPPPPRPLGVERPPEGWAPEDPNGEFSPSTVENGGGRSGQPGPRIIDVGVPGPGSRRLMWRRAWRDKILPAVFNFQPDLILISAGFDAHKAEDINMRFVGVTESDYEWLTHQLVELSNRCCAGRLVSVLEGGYNLRGGLVSAFARSVAAHVRALASGNTHAWDAHDGRLEREYEAKRREQAAQTALAAAAVQTAAAQHAKQAAAKALKETAAAMTSGPDCQVDKREVRSGPTTAELLAAAPQPEASTAFATEAKAVDSIPDDDAPGAKRRRRGAPVDYAALNAKLQSEAATRQNDSL
mmetsp:Transcript_500/g.1334  ORF Transcript_500/g.1334 Transcript_500/m.1334 type:complete len:917 (-) Transcript_500:2486-5236(-)